MALVGTFGVGRRLEPPPVPVDLSAGAGVSGSGAPATVLAVISS